MEDFFKQFRENLEQRSAPEFDAHDWQDLSTRLDRVGRKHSVVGVRWLLALPFLLLAGANTFFFWQWKKAVQRISALEIRQDTVYRTSVVYITDTVYHRRAGTMPNLFFVTPKDGQGTNSTRLAFLSDTLEVNAASYMVAKTIAEKDTNQIDQSFGLNGGEQGALSLENNAFILTDHTLQSTDLLPHSAPQPLLRPENLILLETRRAPIVAQKQRKPLLTRIYEARPKSFQIGIIGGWVYPFGEDLDYRSGTSLGGHFAASFSPRLTIWADVSHAETHFIAKRMGDDIGVPTIAPPSDQYVFSKAEAPQPLWQFSAGLQYFFCTGKRLQPFVGLGYGAVSLQPYDVGYEFKHLSLGVVWDFDKTEYAKGWLTDFGLFQTGLQLRVSQKWNAQIRADYRNDFGKSSGLRPSDVLGLGLGLNYCF